MCSKSFDYRLGTNKEAERFCIIIRDAVTQCNCPDLIGFDINDGELAALYDILDELGDRINHLDSKDDTLTIRRIIKKAAIDMIFLLVKSK